MGSWGRGWGLTFENIVPPLHLVLDNTTFLHPCVNFVLADTGENLSPFPFMSSSLYNKSSHFSILLRKKHCMWKIQIPHSFIHYYWKEFRISPLVIQTLWRLNIYMNCKLPPTFNAIPSGTMESRKGCWRQNAQIVQKWFSVQSLHPLLSETTRGARSHDHVTSISSFAAQVS